MTARTSLWFFSMMGAGLVLLALSAIGALGPVENVSYTVLVAGRSGCCARIASPIADTVTNYSDVRDLTRENEALRTENERLRPRSPASSRRRSGASNWSACWR